MPAVDLGRRESDGRLHQHDRTLNAATEPRNLFATSATNGPTISQKKWQVTPVTSRELAQLLHAPANLPNAIRKPQSIHRIARRASQSRLQRNSLFQHQVRARIARRRFSKSIDDTVDQVLFRDGHACSRHSFNVIHAKRQNSIWSRSEIERIGQADRRHDGLNLVVAILAFPTNLKKQIQLGWTPNRIEFGSLWIAIQFTAQVSTGGLSIHVTGSLKLRQRSRFVWVNRQFLFQRHRGEDLAQIRIRTADVQLDDMKETFWRFKIILPVI